MNCEANERKWIDWVQKFSDDIDAKKLLTEMQKREYLKGLLKRIDVRYDPKINGHELLLTFERPLVDDTIQWLDPMNKKKGYTVSEGSF